MSMTQGRGVVCNVGRGVSARTVDSSTAAANATADLLINSAPPTRMLANAPTKTKTRRVKPTPSAAPVDTVVLEPRYASREQGACPHCGKTGQMLALRRWHYDNCRQAPIDSKGQAAVAESAKGKRRGRSKKGGAGEKAAAKRKGQVGVPTARVLSAVVTDIPVARSADVDYLEKALELDFIPSDHSPLSMLELHSEQQPTEPEPVRRRVGRPPKLRHDLGPAGSLGSEVGTSRRPRSKGTSKKLSHNDGMDPLASRIWASTSDDEDCASGVPQLAGLPLSSPAAVASPFRSQRRALYAAASSAAPAPVVVKTATAASKNMRLKGAKQQKVSVLTSLMDNVYANSAMLLSKQEEAELGLQIQALLSLQNTRAAAGKALKREPTLEEWALAARLPLNELTLRLRSGTAAKSRLLEANHRLVIAIAKQYSKRGQQLEDLISLGMIGLATAAEKFNPSKGYKFSTYASWWIAQALSRFGDKQSRVMHVPGRPVEIRRMVVRTEGELKSAGLPHSPADIAAALGEKTWAVEAALKLGIPALSLEAFLEKTNNSGGGSVLDTLADDPSDDGDDTSEERMQNTEMKEAVHALLKRILNERERTIVMHRAALLRDTSATLQELAALLQLSKERVRQIEKVAMKKLRSELERSPALQVSLQALMLQ